MKTDPWFARIYFLFGFVIYIFAGKYIDFLKLTSTLYDPILELIPVIDLSILEAYGLLFVYAAIAVFLWPLLNSEKEREFWVMAGTVLIIRSIMCFSAGFGPPAGYFISDNYPFFYNWFPRYDFFFSGHTAAPFFCFLFFEGRLKKIFFLILTVVMASTVLLLHHHYVIDVLAAPFVVGAIYACFRFWVFGKKEGRKK